MKFAQPYLLNLLWGLIPLASFLVYGILKRKKILMAFAEPNMISSLVPGFDPQGRWIKLSLIIMAFGFAIFALSFPQWGYKWEKTTQKGVDIMIALDCSKSMLAQDIKPNRLERAKREIVDLLRMMRSDRAGLVAFAGQAILQCPLTLDHEAFNIFLKVLEPGFLPVGGTNIDSAIKQSYNGFEKDSDTKKAIIVITDGEATLGDARDTAKEMAKQGIKIFFIGVGGLQGAPIPDGEKGFKKDLSGNIILSKVDTKTLEKLAAMTGGTFVRSVAGDMDLDLIYRTKILGTMERKTLTSGKKKVWENRYQWFLFPCIILLMIEFMLPLKKRIKKIPLLFLIIGITIFNFPDTRIYAKTVSSSVNSGIKAFEEKEFEKAKTHFIDAQLEDPENPKLYYNIGAAAYMNNEFDQAKKNFEQAIKTKDEKLQQDAQYNLANTNFRLGNLDEAIKGYETILKKSPDDTQAKENLEFVRQKKREQQKQSPSDKDKKDKDKKGKDKKDGENKNQGQNPDKDTNKNRDENKDGKDKNKDLEQPGQQNIDQSNNKQDTEKEPRNKDEDRPGNKTSRSGQEDTKASVQDKRSKQANQVLDNMLNRLEDKPGGAMMPVLQEQHVEKDW